MPGRVIDSAAPISTDALVIGAGPVGLFQVFQLGLQEIHCEVVDSLPRPGGQCVELYGDKPIYDIPGIPVCTGRELSERLLLQIQPFGAGLHVNQDITALDVMADGSFAVATSAGKQFHARSVFIAAGVGAFQPRRLKVDGLDAFEGTQLHYRVDDATAFAGQHLVVVGGDATALDWALQFADGPSRAASVTLVHRRDSLQAATGALARLRALVDAGSLRFMVGQVTGCQSQGGRLTHAELTGPDGAPQLLPLDQLLVFQGLSPKLGAIAGWGLAMERKQLVVDPATFQTSVPGIYAVGDINTYPGKRKLILCGFHEATLAAFSAAPLLFPQRDHHLQYTTTSPRLHRLLGVSHPGID